MRDRRTGRSSTSGLVAGVALIVALGACGSPGQSLTQPTPSTLPSEPSPSPPASATPSQTSSPARWELVRFDHPDGLYSFSYPKGWFVDVHRTSEPPPRATVQSFPEKVNPTPFGPDEIKIDVALTTYKPVRVSDTPISTNGLSGQYAVQSGRTLDPAWEGSGVRMTAGAIFRLPQEVGRFDGIGIQMLSGEASDVVRDLFLELIRSLEVHQ